jgi:hypothetical protein
MPLAVAVSVAPGPVQAQQGRGPCRQDIEKFCAGIQPGAGRYRDCLEQHASELSPGCQKHLTEVKARMTAWRQACQADVQKFCSGATPGRGNIVRCLRAHHDDLSQACKDQLAKRRHGPPPGPGQ